MRTPLGPGDPRVHHYVPQFFLRRFADGDQIARVELRKPDRHVLANVKNVAAIKDFYTTIDVDPTIGETASVERFLADVDGGAVKPIERLAFGFLFPPSNQDRFHVALWIAMLHMRGPGQRRQWEAMSDQAIKMQYSLVHDHASARAHLTDADGSEPTDTEVQELLAAVRRMDEIEFVPHQNDFIQMMLDFGVRSVPFYLRRYWTVFKFREKGLILTDRPVAQFQRPENRSPYVGHGVGNSDEIWLPLDRSTALIMHDDPAIGDRVVFNPPGYSVDDFNQVTITHSFNEVYCHPDDLHRLRGLQLPPPNRTLLMAEGADFVRGTTDGLNAPAERMRHRRYRRARSSS